jgi:hypothetical protein
VKSRLARHKINAAARLLFATFPARKGSHGMLFKPIFGHKTVQKAPFMTEEEPTVLGTQIAD